MKRDRETRRKLEDDGWKVLVIWECETKARKSIEVFFKEKF